MSNYHIDLTLGGDAAKFQFLWMATEHLLSQNAQLTIATNLAVQSVKVDKPMFTLDFLRENKVSLRAFRAQLNHWMQKHQVAGPDYSSVFNLVTCLRDKAVITEDELSEATEAFSTAVEEMRINIREMGETRAAIAQLPGIPPP